MSEFLMETSEDTSCLLQEIVDEMISMFGISRREAVARVNRQWKGMDLSGEDEIILHEDAYYWCLAIYYGVVSDWSPSADRSTWEPIPAPDPGSDVWPA